MLLHDLATCFHLRLQLLVVAGELPAVGRFGEVNHITLADSELHENLSRKGGADGIANGDQFQCEQDWLLRSLSCFLRLAPGAYPTCAPLGIPSEIGGFHPAAPTRSRFGQNDALMNQSLDLVDSVDDSFHRFLAILCRLPEQPDVLVGP